MNKEHRIHIEVSEVDNGFILRLFNECGQSKDDHELFLGDMELVLDGIRHWCTDLGLVQKKPKKDVEK